MSDSSWIPVDVSPFLKVGVTDVPYPETGTVDVRLEAPTPSELTGAV